MASLWDALIDAGDRSLKVRSKEHFIHRVFKTAYLVDENLKKYKVGLGPP